MPVQTVLGPRSSDQLGRTLTHEHFSLDFRHFYVPPPVHLTPYLSGKIKLENVGFFKQYPYGSKYNINFSDDDTHQQVLEDVKLFKKWGGGTIVENTSHGLERNLEFLVKVASDTNVNVIAGTGHYIAMVQSQDSLKQSIEQLVDLYTKELVSGIDIKYYGETVNVKCGFIGEVGSGWPLVPFEKHTIRATAEAQEALGCGVSFHPGREANAPFEIIRLYLEAGGKPDKCVMSHLDRTIFNEEKLLEFAALGVYCQFDLFGTECSYYQLNPNVSMRSDAQRIDSILKLVKEGHVERILLSHDIHTKQRLVGFGGHGYGHILNNILPQLTTKGLTKEQVDQITIKNPAAWLDYSI